MIEEITRTVKGYEVVDKIYKRFKTSDGTEFMEKDRDKAERREAAYQRYLKVGKIYPSDRLAYSLINRDGDCYGRYIEFRFWVNVGTNEEVEDLSEYLDLNGYSLLGFGKSHETYVTFGEWTLIICSKEEGDCRDSYYIDSFTRSELLELLDGWKAEIPY